MDFVIGHPRSGTALLARLLNAAGGQPCRHEYLAALRPESVPLATDYYEGRVDGPAVDRLLEGYERSATPWVRIDSNWKLTWILPVLLERYPEARVVHLARDPRTNVRSCVNLDFYGGMHERPEFAYRRFWLSAMPQIARPDWDQLSVFERNCAFWAETHRLAFAALGGGRSTRLVRLEELARPQTRRALFDFLGVPRPSAWRSRRVARTRVNGKHKVKGALAGRGRQPLADYTEWDDRHRARLNELCGETARRLGYDVG